MVKSLTCVAKSGTTAKSISSHFGYICGEGQTDCGGISTDAEAGKYGAYSMCSPIEQLSWAMNEYYNAQGQASTSCDFDGDAQKQTPAKSEETCATLIKEAEASLNDSTKTGGSTSGKKDDDESAANLITSPILAVLAIVGGVAAVLA